MNRWAVEICLASNSTEKIFASVTSGIKHSMQTTTYTWTTNCQKRNAYVSVIILPVGMFLLLATQGY